MYAMRTPLQGTRSYPTVEREKIKKKPTKYHEHGIAKYRVLVDEIHELHGAHLRRPYQLNLRAHPEVCQSGNTSAERSSPRLEEWL